eukprot:6457017-Amphidinium_carterae.1
MSYNPATYTPAERQPHIFGANALQWRRGAPIATAKVPPTWDPADATGVEHAYSLQEWEQDLLRWSAATEIPAERQAPLVSLALGGAARAVADEFPAAVLRNGGFVDIGDGPRQYSGLELLVEALKRKFPVSQEAELLRAGVEFVNFAPRRGETLELVLLRWDRLLSRAEQVAGFAISWSFRAWLLLSAL